VHLCASRCAVAAKGGGVGGAGSGSGGSGNGDSGDGGSPSSQSPSDVDVDLPSINTTQQQTTQQGENGVCFAKDTASACLVIGDASPAAAYSRCYDGAADELAQLVLMAELQPGDRVLTAHADGTLALTRVIVVQHTRLEKRSAVVELHTSTQTSLSLTPSHGLYIDGQLAAASEVVAGSLLRAADGSPIAVARVTTRVAPVINPVTVAGSILASDGDGAPLLAASHPIWIAPLLLESPMARAITNGALLLVGDVASIADGALYVLAHLAAAISLVRLVTRAARSTMSS